MFFEGNPEVFPEERDAAEVYVMHKTAREDYTFRGEFLGMGPLQFQELPAHLGAERFGNNPAMSDPIFFQPFQDRLRVLLESPGFSPGIGELHETIVRKDLTAEIADHGPIPMDAG